MSYMTKDRIARNCESDEMRQSADILTRTYGGAISYHVPPLSLVVYGVRIDVFPNGKCRIDDGDLISAEAARSRIFGKLNQGRN